ncbi:DMT family transporter [Psychrobium sp. nBUS_13]|uniref:DMT family transporter n=1 Tax=Psychrobium sp. nBUS_13 TaxID=3395319 RepID=UPI003EC00DB5
MSPSANPWTKFIPAIFVFLWSTGFIGAKFALPYIEPFYLLFLRLALTVVVFGLLMWWYKAPWMSKRQFGHQAVSGLLIHGAYLGGVFSAVAYSMPAGVIALLVSIQPLLTALILFRTKPIKTLQWLGLALGFIGVVVVLFSKGAIADFTFNWPMMIGALVALLGITIGSLYQKRFGQGVNLLSASTAQYIVTALLMAVLTYSFEHQQVDWQWPLIASLLWLVFGMSVLAILLLLYMIKNGASEKVASYFYLVPGITAIQAWLYFDEQFPPLAIGGMLLSLLGVYLTVKPQK